MKKLIHKYLSDYYKIVGEKVLLLKDYKKHNADYRYYFHINAATLIADLELVFGFTKRELKWIVKSWIHKQNKGFRFNHYWNPPPLDFGSVLFPMVRRVHSRLYAQEIVSVQPMAMPSGILYYMDHHVDNPIMGIDVAHNHGNDSIAIGMHTLRANTTGSGMSRRHRTSSIIDEPEPDPQWGYLNKYLESNETLASKLSAMTKYYGNLNLVK